MMTRLARTLFVAACAAGATLSAQQTAAPPAFRFERPIVTAGAGPRRLAIDVPLLVGAAPFRTAVRGHDPSTGLSSVALGDGLRDLRVYDAGGAEIGYMLVSAPEAAPLFRTATTLPIPSVETRTVKTSGFEADLGEALTIDRFRVDGIGAPFLKRVRLEAGGDRERWTTLVADGTLFDLPDERLRQLELRFRAGSYRYLRLTFDDSNSARVTGTPIAAAGQPPSIQPPPPLTTPVAFERRASEPGRSRFRLRLPGGRLPIVALDVDAGGGHIYREARVFQAQLSGAQLVPMQLGSAALRRVVRDGVVAAAMRLPIAPPTEAQLDLEVDDADNPPLDLRGIMAVFAQLPWIYTEAPAATLTARYGNPALVAPRYDIEATRDQLHIENVADATWGEPRTRAAEENAAAAPPPLPTVGASLETTLFQYLRDVPAGPAGLLAIALDAPAIAHSAGPSRQFADLRVVDDGDRQIPYIVEQTAEPLSLDLTVERVAAPRTLPSARSGRSVYRVNYPVAGLPPARLVLTTAARVFRRGVSVGQEHEADPRHRRDPWFDTVASAQWIHADQDRDALPLALSVPPIQGTSLFIVVDEGDNTPLPISAARLLLPSFRVRLFRGGSAALRVAYGRKDLARPQYDLALLAPQVLGTPATDIALEPERAPVSTATTAGVVSPRLFWGALVIAVVVLIGLIARLLEKESAG
jgi:uncharacterized protein DUF3999